tara:strand:+ start:26547 stop:26660 length:114 start_codon:yes stop_codon:yes gene_type:complete
MYLELARYVYGESKMANLFGGVDVLTTIDPANVIITA